MLYKLQQQNEVTDVILETLEGPYNTVGQALYWESILGMQHLLLTFTVFVENLIVKYVLINILCIIFFWHYMLIQPFKEQISNCIETLSLMFIIITSSIHLLKSSVIYRGVIPHHHLRTILGLSGNAENIFLICLFCLILVAKICQRNMHR